MRMKAAVALLLHLGVLMCLSVQVQGQFAWDPTTAPIDAAGRAPHTIKAPTIVELWHELINRTEMRYDALETRVSRLEQSDVEFHFELNQLREADAEARRQLESSIDRALHAIQNNLTSVWTWINHDMASRSAFSVALTNNETLTCCGPYDEPMTVIYRYEFLNVGGDYNASSGVFTVRLPGVYVLAVTAYSNSGQPFEQLKLCASLIVNSTMVVNFSEKYRQDQEDSATAVVSLRLHVGDTVEVILPAGCRLCDDNGHHNTFTGFLLYADDHSTHNWVK